MDILTRLGVGRHRFSSVLAVCCISLAACESPSDDGADASSASDVSHGNENICNIELMAPPEHAPQDPCIYGSALLEARVERASDAPAAEQFAFSAAEAGPACIVAQSGHQGERHRVASAWISLDNELLVEPERFSQQVVRVEHGPFELSSGEHVLEVKVASQPETSLDVALLQGGNARHAMVASTKLEVGNLYADPPMLVADGVQLSATGSVLALPGLPSGNKDYEVRWAFEITSKVSCNVVRTLAGSTPALPEASFAAAGLWDGLDAAGAPVHDAIYAYRFVAELWALGQESTTRLDAVATAYQPILVDTQPPEIFVDFPSDGDVLNEPHVVVQGRVVDRSPVRVWVNGVEADVEDENFVSLPIALEPGLQDLHVYAEDIAGNGSQVTVQVAFSAAEHALVVDAQGGRLVVADPTSPLVGAFVDVPPGAVDGLALVEIDMATGELPLLPGAGASLPILFQISSSLLEPVSLGIPYEAEAVAVHGVLENDLRPYVVRDGAASWQAHSDYTVDPESKIIRVDTASLSIWQAVIEASASTLQMERLAGSTDECSSLDIDPHDSNPHSCRGSIRFGLGVDGSGNLHFAEEVPTTEVLGTKVYLQLLRADPTARLDGNAILDDNPFPLGVMSGSLVLPPGTDAFVLGLRTATTAAAPWDDIGYVGLCTDFECFIVAYDAAGDARIIFSPDSRDVFGGLALSQDGILFFAYSAAIYALNVSDTPIALPGRILRPGNATMVMGPAFIDEDGLVPMIPATLGRLSQLTLSALSAYRSFDGVIIFLEDIGTALEPDLRVRAANIGWDPKTVAGQIIAPGSITTLIGGGDGPYIEGGVATQMSLTSRRGHGLAMTLAGQVALSLPDRLVLLTNQQRLMTVVSSELLPDSVNDEQASFDEWRPADLVSTRYNEFIFTNFNRRRIYKLNVPGTICSPIQKVEAFVGPGPGKLTMCGVDLHTDPLPKPHRVSWQLAQAAASSVELSHFRLMSGAVQVHGTAQATSG